MNKNIKKLIVCVMAVASIATTNIGGSFMPVVANAATVEGNQVEQQYKATIVAVGKDEDAEEVGTIFNDTFTVNDVFKAFKIDVSEIRGIEKITVSQTDKEKINVYINDETFLKSSFDIKGESKEDNTGGTEISIKYTILNEKDEKKDITLKFKVIMSKDINYTAEIVSGTVDGKKKDYSKTLYDNFTAESALNAFGITGATVTDVKVSETDSEKISVSDADTKDYDLNTRFDITGVTRNGNENKGTQIRIRYKIGEDGKEQTLKFNVKMSEVKNS